MASTASAASSDDLNGSICRYYARGMCRFGHLCRFVHPNVPANSVITEASCLPMIGKACASSHSAGDTSCDRGKAGRRSMDPKNWVLAPVFVPKSRQRPTASASSSSNSGERKDIPSSSLERVNETTYASVVMGPEGSTAYCGGGGNETTATLCPYQYNCPYGEMCIYEHNQLCDMCGRYVLHPTDKEQRKTHIAQCIQQHEKDMELSFAVARSKDKTCGICFEIIMEKSGREQRFGILPNCNHIFCLECIRKWRQAKQFENKIIRACPECRIPSDYVCPSAFWVETKDDKEKLIVDYKKALGEKDCKYFKKGEGKCPFGNKCFYKHALPGGERVDVGVPKRNKRKIHRAEDEILDLFDIYLWDFVDRREFHWLEILSNFSDSGDSDWSEDFE